MKFYKPWSIFITVYKKVKMTDHKNSAANPDLYSENVPELNMLMKMQQKMNEAKETLTTQAENLSNSTQNLPDI